MDLFSPRHLLIILVVVLLVFGTKKLRTIGSDLGSAVKGFKKAMNEGEQEEAAVPKQLPANAAPASTAHSGTDKDAEFHDVGAAPDPARKDERRG